MVRRDVMGSRSPRGKNPPVARCASPAGASPVPVSAEAPGSRPQTTEGDLGVQAGRLDDGKQGFDFLGCHLHKRLSGRIGERERRQLYFLQRWPSTRSMQCIRQRVKEPTASARCHADIREVIDALNPVLRGWSNYFRTGNAALRFGQLDDYVWRRLKALRVKRKGRHLRAGEAERWTREYFEKLGLVRLRGTVRYPKSPCWEAA